jgi:hypothetical protein
MRALHAGSGRFCASRRHDRRFLKARGNHRSIAVKTRTATLLFAAAIGVGAGTAIADEEMIVTGQPPPQALSVNQEAINACVTAFASKLPPPRNAQVRVVMPSRYAEVFSKLDAMDRETSKVMEVDMQAYSPATDRLLAKSVCRVGINATVLNLSIEAARAS